MATVEKAVKHRKMWKKSTSRKSAVGRCSVKEMGVFDISHREAEVLVQAIQSHRSLTPELKSLVSECARKCSLQ